LAENYYGKFIAIARAGGMQAVSESEHFAQCIEARPENRERILRTDPDEFIQVMSYWRECFLQSATLPIVGCDRSATSPDRGAGLPDRRQRRDPYACDGA
jgi:hypothetical protein